MVPSNLVSFLLLSSLSVSLRRVCALAFAFSIRLEASIGRTRAGLFTASVDSDLSLSRRWQNFRHRCSLNRGSELRARAGPLRFAEICLPFPGRHCFHCFAPATGLRNFVFPPRTERCEERLRTVRLLSLNILRASCVTVCRNCIVIQTYAQKIPPRRCFLLALCIAKPASSNVVSSSRHGTRARNR